MKTLLQFLLFMAMAIVVIGIAILLGDKGAWYFAWLVGTAMIVLVAAAGGVLLDTQDDQAGPKVKRNTGNTQEPTLPGG